jgi:hypothetical protein
MGGMYDEPDGVIRPRGWPWREPVRVTGGLLRYRIWTNADVHDDNPWFLFSRDGRLIFAAWAARRL